jgi:hypothetical protein
MFIKTNHNSNLKTKQMTLEGGIIQEFCYYVVGFVPADVIRLKEAVWFSKLSSEQISLSEKYLQENQE